MKIEIGGGSFYTVFPPYKTADLPWQWNHAHNDFVEVALLAGAAVLWLAFLRQETCCHEPERFDRLG